MFNWPYSIELMLCLESLHAKNATRAHSFFRGPGYLTYKSEKLRDNVTLSSESV